MWDTLNGGGVAFQSFHGLTGGGYLGTVEDLNTMTGQAVSTSLSVSGAYGAAKLELILATDQTNLSPLGIPNGSGIVFGVGPGLGFSAEARNTFAIPLVGENGVLLAKQNPHSARETLAAMMDSSGYVPPDIQEFLLENPEISKKIMEKYANLNKEQIEHLRYNGGMSYEFASALEREYLGLLRECFGAGTPVTMADGSMKAIEDVRSGDEVLSYDAEGSILPGRVTRTFKNEVRCVLDLHGLSVTPGHAIYCADGRFAGRHVPVIDILRADGALMRADGTLIRASTGAEVGSIDDRMLHCVLTRSVQGGKSLLVVGDHFMRYGTRVVLEDGQDVSIHELVEAEGGHLNEVGEIEMPDGVCGPFIWSAVQPMFPRPEDYVLSRSGLTLKAIYEADEWETARPEMPAPSGTQKLDIDGSSIGAELEGARNAVWIN
ncbi:MAG: hypothetical protein P1U65_08855 [Minwuia sp.]|nr:hypothetical protein [Minwuia sp.]